MKERYKFIMSQVRRQKNRRISLVNMLINIRSSMRHRNIYKDEIEQFRYLLGKNKTWNDDVWNHFFRKYKGYLESPYMYRPLYGHRYEGKSKFINMVAEDELPF